MAKIFSLKYLFTQLKLFFLNYLLFSLLVNMYVIIREGKHNILMQNYILILYYKFVTEHNNVFTSHAHMIIINNIFASHILFPFQNGVNWLINEKLPLYDWHCNSLVIIPS